MKQNTMNDKTKLTLELLEALKNSQVRIFMLEGNSEAYDKCTVAISSAERFLTNETLNPKHSRDL